MAQNKVLQIWRTAQAVCFDVDSTLYATNTSTLFKGHDCMDRIQEESIDELADFLGMGERIAQLTER